MHADHVLGPRRRAGQRRDEDRRRVRRDDRLLAADLRQLLEQLALEVWALGRRLDHELGVRQPLELFDRVKPRPGGVRLLGAPAPPLGAPREPFLDLGAPALYGRGKRVVERRLHTREDPELGDAGAHRARPDHPEMHRRRGHWVARFKAAGS